VSNALELHDLHVTIAGSHVLQGVTFDVPQGGVTALLGRNGVGKTTTLRAVLGLVPSTGDIRVFDHDVSGMMTHRIARLGIAYVPEDRDVFAGISVNQNLRLAEHIAEPRYDEVYDLFPELKTRGRQLAGTLSGGQQQMLSIARALLNGWPLLLVDEPSKGLAPKLVTEFAAVLERAAQDATVLLVEQNLSVVKRLAQRIVILDHGEVVHIGDAGDLADETFVRGLLGVGGAS
jgi:branched-chain amino acid transport system ATP-binding protein